MGFLTDWGFNRQSWQGARGEYWVVAQALLLLGFALLPVYRPFPMLEKAPGIYGVWAIAVVLGIPATIFIIKGLFDLGGNLTPLPHPKDSGQLVQEGVYKIVRHPLYSGLTLAAFGWAIYIVSLSHLLGAFALLGFFNAKATLEENWLMQKFPDYASYRQRVKKLIPWLY